MELEGDRVRWFDRVIPHCKCTIYYRKFLGVLDHGNNLLPWSKHCNSGRAAFCNLPELSVYFGGDVEFVISRGRSVELTCEGRRMSPLSAENSIVGVVHIA